MIYLYADDLTLFYEIKSNDDPVAKTARLSKDLERMKNWTDRWNVTFEPSKCNAMTISRKRTHQPSWIFCLVTPNLQKKRSWKSLLTIDSKLTWTKHCMRLSGVSGRTSRSTQVCALDLPQVRVV